MFRRCAFTAARAALADAPRASSAASLGCPASRDAAAAAGAGFGARRWMSSWVVGSIGSMGGAPGYVSTRPPVAPARIVEARPHQHPAIPETGVTRWDVNIEHGSIGRGGGEMELTAVPKRKVTPSRKRKRNQFKRIGSSARLFGAWTAARYEEAARVLRSVQHQRVRSRRGRGGRGAAAGKAQ